MEMQFEKRTLSCVQPVLENVHTRELTQELRLGDGMPDVGSVLGCWGQVILRGKRWESGEAGVNGGVMVWVLCAPEDGGEPMHMESWIPFQMDWPLPETQTDGTLQVNALLSSVDARITSARKLMLRCCVSTMLRAFVPTQVQIPFPGELPEDIRVKKVCYRLELPAETGEKAFSLEDTLPLPAGSSKAEKLICCRLQPEVLDKKVMTDKVVFRGCGLLQMLYRTPEGKLHSETIEMPFSQYAQLDGEYGEETPCSVLPAVTSLETELAEGQLKVKAGLLGQYTVYDRQEIEMVADAYSSRREVIPMETTLQIPTVLDRTQRTIPITADLPTQGEEIVNISFLPSQPERSGDGVVVDGIFQTLWYTPDGQIGSQIRRSQGTVDLPAAADSTLSATVLPTGEAQANSRLKADVLGEFVTYSGNGIPAVTGLSVGEERPKDPNRPSLILRRAGEETLWELAKKTGSTVEAIQKANNLADMPTPGQILLIPVP